MATRAKTACRHPACPRLVEEPGYCEQHAKLHQKRVDAARGNSAERGYDGKWRKERDAFLREHPLCECDECIDRGRLVAATVVDHTIPHRLKEAKDGGDQAAIRRAYSLFWDRKNWKAMSKPCHDRKTARQDGGWGRSA